MFSVEQTYDIQTMTALNVAARKKVRRWYNLVRVGAWILLILSAGTMLMSMVYGIFGLDDWILPVAALVMILFLVFDDKLNGWVSLRQLLPGSAHSVTTFTDESYTVKTDTTVTEYRYENISCLCETERYFIFFLGNKHGQCFDKQCFQQGDSATFRTWMQQKTGLSFQTVK